MTITQEKIKYINAVLSFFYNAKNHGHNGDNWWYPVENRIAYNVKMRKWVDIATLRKHLTKRQNEFYTDEEMADIISEEMSLTAEHLQDSIRDKFGLNSQFAGRSAGWIEVDYDNNIEGVGDDDDITIINIVYIQAKKLDALENEVRNFIIQEHKTYNDYLDTPKYYQDLKETMMTDEDIANAYKDQIKTLADKLN